MLRTVLFLLTSLANPLHAAPSEATHTLSRFELAATQFAQLEAELPFSAIEAKELPWVHANYRSARSTLALAIEEWRGGDLARGGRKAREASGRFRRVGLLVPFWAIVDRKEQLAAMDRYLAAEDLLLDALKNSGN